MSKHPFAATVLIALVAAQALCQQDEEKPRDPVPEATIAVTSDPPGARIYIGHEGGGTGMHLKGVTSAEGPETVSIHSAIEEATHRYRVTLTYPGYDSFTRVLEVRQGDALALDARLDPRCKRAYVQDGAIIVEGWNGGSAKPVAQVGEGLAWERLAWSPNGRYLAFARMGEIWVADVSWSRVWQVTDVGGAAATAGMTDRWVCESPYWSPDGHHILYIAHGDQSSLLQLAPLVLTAPDERPGGGEEPLPYTPEIASDVLTPRTLAENRFASIDAWHPTRPTIALETHVSAPGGPIAPYSELALLPLTPDLAYLASEETYIPHAGQASWSADGSRFAYTLRDPASGLSILYVADGNGLAQSPLVQSEEGSIRRPIWSPDGGRIAYILQWRGEDRMLEEIHVVDVRAPDDDRVVLEADPIPFDEGGTTLNGFTPDGREIAFSRGQPQAPRTFTVPIEGGQSPRPLLARPAALLTYSSGLPQAVYRSLEAFRTDLLRTLEVGDIGWLDDLCLPVLEKVDSNGKLIREQYEDERDAALARIVHNAGPSGVEQANHTPYAGEDGRFEQVTVLGGSGRKLFLTRSDGRWYVAGYYLAN